MESEEKKQKERPRVHIKRRTGNEKGWGRGYLKRATKKGGLHDGAVAAPSSVRILDLVLPLRLLRRQRPNIGNLGRVRRHRHARRVLRRLRYLLPDHSLLDDPLPLAVDPIHLDFLPFRRRRPSILPPPLRNAIVYASTGRTVLLPTTDESLLLELREPLRLQPPRHRCAQEPISSRPPQNFNANAPGSTKSSNLPVLPNSPLSSLNTCGTSSIQGGLGPTSSSLPFIEKLLCRLCVFFATTGLLAPLSAASADPEADRGGTGRQF